MTEPTTTKPTYLAQAQAEREAAAEREVVLADWRNRNAGMEQTRDALREIEARRAFRTRLAEQPSF